MSATEEEIKPPPNPLASEYQAIEGEYRREVAILEARPFIERWGIVLWGMVDVLLIIAAVAMVPTYIVSGSFMDSRMAASILSNAANIHPLVLAQAPKSLDLADAVALTGEIGTTDFLADVTNPNTEWYVTFNYTFTYDGGETVSDLGFLAPNESRPLTALHIQTDSLARNQELVIKDIVWHRVNRHLIADTATFITDRNEFPISNVVSVADIGLGKTAVARTDFTIQNRTAFSYWDPKYIILLMRSSTPVAIQEVTATQFAAGETRQMSVRWFQPVPAGATVKIIPAIDYFDDSVYMKPLGE